MVTWAAQAHAAYVLEPTMEPVVRGLLKGVDEALPSVKTRGAGLNKDHATLSFQDGEGRLHKIEVRHPEQAEAGDISLKHVILRTELEESHPIIVALRTRLDDPQTPWRWRLAGKAGAPSPLAVARARLVMMDIPGVLEAVTDGETLAPRDGRVLTQAAVILKAAGLEDKATQRIKAAKAVLMTDDDGIEATIEGAILDYLTEGRVTDEQMIRERLVRGGASACALVRLGNALEVLGQEEEALSLVERVVAIAPSCRDGRRLQCELLGRSKRWAALLQCVEAGQARFPDDPDFKIRRATALRGLGRYDDARDALEAEVRRNPHDSGPMSSLAALYTMTRTSHSGYEALNTACEADREDLVSCFLAGVIAHYLARHTECVAHMTQLKNALPNQPRVPMYAAISSFFLGRVDDADRLIDQAAEISGATDPDVFYCRSLIRRERDMKGASEDLERFLKVAHRGWHSEGKIGRVTNELNLLRAGTLPPPAEAHHRAEERDRTPEEKTTPSGSQQATASVEQQREDNDSRDKPWPLTELTLMGLIALMVVIPNWILRWYR